MSSTRLPGKVLAPVEGAPMIARQIERLQRSQRLDALVLATSAEASDDPLATCCQALGLEIVRGPLADVLGRFGLAMDRFPQAKTLVRLTADCPLTDWRILDAMIDHHLGLGVDYTNNTMPERTFPHGLDVEAVQIPALRTALAEASDPYDREHVTPFIYRNPDRFRIGAFSRAPSLADLRWTVDYPADLDFVRGVYAALYAGNPDFTVEDIVALSPNSAPHPAA
jgi:spore coat polysaccharide biosynthesis protein SpsF